MTNQNNPILPFDHPMQPTYMDGEVVRFVCNPIVGRLLDHGMATGCGLNALTIASKELGFTENDWRQFSQLHGYSVGGFCDLSFVSEPEDGYYEYLGKQVPEYFNPDDEPQEADSEPREADNRGCLDAIKSLAEILEKQAIQAHEVQRMLKDQLNEAVTLAAKVTEEKDKLRGHYNDMLESSHIFHECDGKIRTYPALCCSLARSPGDHSPDDDFDALERIKQLQERGDRIWVTLREVAYSYGRGEPYHEIINILDRMFEHPDSPPADKEIAQILRDNHNEIVALRENPLYAEDKVKELEAKVAELEAEKAPQGMLAQNGNIMTEDKPIAKCRGCGMVLDGSPYHLGGQAYLPGTTKAVLPSHYGGWVCSRRCDVRSAQRLEDSMPGGKMPANTMPSCYRHESIDEKWERFER